MTESGLDHVGSGGLPGNRAPELYEHAFIPDRCEEIVGQSLTLRMLLKEVEVVAPTDATVLVRGETGTGKELLARAIHERSLRSRGEFVKVNCAAIPTGLLESELFGHDRGAFTGALVQRIGRFELADGGTLLLDEIGDIPAELQPKLLRVLQEREFERLGSCRTIRSDVRVIAATHRDLEQMVEDGKFRADLYYRLNVFPMRVPPLRERPEDIPPLVREFVFRFADRMHKQIETIRDADMKLLMSFDWPGNVRQLQNFIERAVIVTTGDVLQLPDDLKRRPKPKPRTATLKELEREHIINALEQTDWIVGGPSGAAARLGLPRTTLIYKMYKLGIRRNSQYFPLPGSISEES